jgi:hypothetical protein
MCTFKEQCNDYNRKHCYGDKGAVRVACFERKPPEQNPDVSKSELNGLLPEDVVAAMRDAIEYVDTVADDRMESVIDGDRKEEIIEIIDDFLNTL